MIPSGRVSARCRWRTAAWVIMLRFDAERLRVLVEQHLLFTGSARARALLDDWDNALASFVKVMPLDYRRALTDLRAERQAAKAAAAD